MKERTQGWHITPLPSHPVTVMVAYLVGAIGLQFVSAWLLMPTMVQRGTWRFWTRYGATLAACLGGCLIAAFVILFLVMALLDAGVI